MKEKNALNGNESNPLFSQSFLNFVPLICALMVVLIHQYNIGDSMSTDISARIVGFFSHGVCTAAVPMFFFLSGYLFYRNLTSLKMVFQKQKKRVVSVLVPFIAWSFSYYILFAIVSKVLPGTIETPMDLGFAGIIKGIIFYRYSFPLWYMFQLVVFILLAPIIFYVLKNRVVRIAVLLITAIIGLFFLPSVEIDVGGYERALFHFNFFAYYFAGCSTACETTAVKRIFESVRKIPLYVYVILFIGFSFMASLFFDEVILSFNSRCFVPIVFITFLFMMIKVCERLPKLSKCPVSTMVIYGIHSFVGLIFSRVVLSLLQLPVLVEYVVSFVIVTAGSFVIGYILKFVKPLYFIFSGNR